MTKADRLPQFGYILISVKSGSVFTPLTTTPLSVVKHLRYAGAVKGGESRDAQISSRAACLMSADNHPSTCRFR
ncbi:MAG: hypothetical protein GPOALKHO_000302 [Sodalis sp.]|nr:MAG: hypothetical protein GPOALKHO_000302 [Sodalis sp.]